MKKLFLLLGLGLCMWTAEAQVYGLERDTVYTVTNASAWFAPRDNDDTLSYNYPLCDYSNPFIGTNPFITARGGTWQITPADSIIYYPPTGHVGKDSFYYAICSPNNYVLDTAMVTIFIQPAVNPNPFPTDSVWPGDANYDGVANNQDLLPIGLFYGYVGTHRPNPSTNWMPQASHDWYDTLQSGVNIKHVDTNGDSLIVDNDTLAIHLNYGLMHNKGAQGGTGPLFYLTFTEDTILAGDTAEVLINVGMDTSQVDLYGISFSIGYDTSLVDGNSLEVHYQNSWLGDKSTNMLTLDRNFPVDGQLDMALTRKDQNNQMGYGELARFKIIMVDDLTAKADLARTLTLTPFNVYAITRDGAELPLSPQAGNAVVFQEEQNNTSIRPEWFEQVKLFPNPAQDRFTLRLEGITGSQLSLTDLNGKTVYQQNRLQQVNQINISTLPDGIYFLRIQTSKGVYQEKLLKY